MILETFTCPGHGQKYYFGRFDSFHKNICFSFFFVFLGPHPQHMKVPRLGVQLELQLPAYATATATPYPSRVFDLHHSSQQRWILNPLSKARDRTLNLVVPSQIHFRCATMGTPSFHKNISFTPLNLNGNV